MNFNLGIKQKIGVLCSAISLLFILAGVVLMNIAIDSDGQINLILVAIVGVLIIAVSAAITVHQTNKIVAPLYRLREIVLKINEGDLEARTGVESGDEFEELGTAIDILLDQRVSVIEKIETENEQLNDSIVDLLQTVAQLAEKNLTIRAVVNEDVTGPVADALNLMTSETASVLSNVTSISGDVAEMSNSIKDQSDKVILVANKERMEIEETAAALAKASDNMTRIANLAKTSTEIADLALKSTTMAMDAVKDSVGGINEIRDAISETEKRIKRLGERSQEISGVVTLINNISERTHILALNASMHAASAGEAGRGFAVVADEVQRLAENAREATSEIGTLVNNIQMETAEAVTTMNDLISQVVEGSNLAERSGKQMDLTYKNTQRLVEVVQRIASSALAQARTSNALRDRTEIIRESVRQTGAHLQEQSFYTDQLVDHAMSLVATVGVFKLPENDDDV
jgi:methyl-accepting chemotaxis protein